MEYYVALVHKERGSSYGVSFPDFPGCIAVADSYEGAVEQAAEALAFHAEGMLQDGEGIPAPRSLEQIREAGSDWVDFQERHRRPDKRRSYACGEVSRSTAMTRDVSGPTSMNARRTSIGRRPVSLAM